MTQHYYGTKFVTAWPQEKDGQPGYAVKYEDGYISWSPLNVFLKSYQPLTAMSFGHAIKALKAGRKVARAGWNGKDMWLVYVSGTPAVKMQRGSAYHDAGVTEADIRPHIDMFTAHGQMQPGWVASQNDMLAEDWMVVE